MNEKKHSSTSFGLADTTESAMGRFKLGGARLEAAAAENQKSLDSWSR